MLGQLFKQRVTLFVVKGVIFSIKCQAGENIAKGSADPDIASLTESTYYMTSIDRGPTLSLFTSCHLFLIHATSSKVKQALFLLRYQQQRKHHHQQSPPQLTLISTVAEPMVH